MIIVVAVLGLALALVVNRGPMRSPTMEMRAAVNQVAQALRVARSKAIAFNDPVRFAVDLPSHGFRVDNEQPIRLPKSVAITMIAASDALVGGKAAMIRFNGDGSTSGGRIELTDGRRAAHIAVDWLTGRVSVEQATRTASN